MARSLKDIEADMAKLQAEREAAQNQEADAYFKDIDNGIKALKTLGLEYELVKVTSKAKPSTAGRVMPMKYQFPGGIQWPGIGNLPKGAPAELRKKFEKLTGDENKFKRAELLKPYLINRAA